MAKFKVAAVQTYSKLGDSDGNLQTVLDRISEAARNGAKLVVFPECMNAGYVWRDRDHALSCADPIPGRFTEAIEAATREYGIYVAIGLSERDGDKVYNAAALVGPDGLIGKYEKNFLFDFDPFYFTVGKTGYPVFDTSIGKVGMFICADARIPEGARALALAGAEVLLHITNSTTHEQHEMHEPARANENEVWMVCADKAGREEGLTYPGNSQVIHPDGSILVRGSQFDHEIVYAEIDTEAVAAVRQRGESLMRGRCPSSYGLLTEPYESLPYAKIAAMPIVPSEISVLASPAQICNATGDASDTLRRALKHGDEAAKENARLVVFPELFMTSAQPSAEAARESAELTPKVLDAFAELSNKWQAYYVLNLVEKTEDTLHHTTFVTGPEARIVDRYRKIHLTGHEAAWATAGQEFKVIALPFGNVGIMVGHEVCFFEVARILTCMGADLLAHPAFWRKEREAEMFAKERALENKVFVVAANRTDSDYPGASMIALPNAATPHRAGTAEGDYVFGYLNLAWARDKQIRPGTDLIRNRRPELYDCLVEPVSGGQVGR